MSRLNNLMAIGNISMFFLIGLVAEGYYFTCYSLICLLFDGLATLVPALHIRRLWYYLTLLAAEVGGLYFLAASVVYWVNSSG